MKAKGPRYIGRALLLILLIWAVISTTLAVNYYLLYEKYRSMYANLEESIIRVTIIIDYGNGTVSYFNETTLTAGSTVFDALKKVATVNYTYNEKYGVFVVAINGVENNVDIPGHWWMWYIYDHDKDQWVLGSTACDRWILHNGDMVMWKYEVPSF
ncbi:hypothetical protein DRO02_04640 [archaeon]|nr:MAG: hypothetical protein DRO02_04640 [archaeon]RLG65945.1 MAG: hypothetical protein DRO21_00705 [archaeon]HDM24045.1 DUF4430 domain-containing protein [Candidatus Bathyarchaeota archaeon]